MSSASASNSSEDCSDRSKQQNTGGLSKTISSLNAAEPSGLDAIWDFESNNPATDRAAKAELLEKHWGATFDKRTVEPESLDELLSNYRTSFPDIPWSLNRNHLKHLLAHPKKSAPGPDGIPFSAYAMVADIAEDVFWDCCQDLLAGGTPPPSFNFATMVMLPKKPSIEVDGVRWFAPKDTRPLSVTNADNRIIANVFRDVFAEFASKLCLPEQRGFLKNRFLIENVVDVDFESRKCYLRKGNGGLLLIDLAAAFPSLSHEYLFKVLERQGVPGSFCSALKVFYENNRQFLKLDGEISESFVVRSGVRQGCPLSPVLFALALDPFLHLLKTELPNDAVIRAYADDMAVVLQDIRQIPLVAKAFTVLHRASALQVNIAKTVLVPLYPTTREQLKNDISKTQWSDVKISLGCDKYLGYLVGPMANAEMNFAASMHKFRERTAQWLSMRQVGSFFQCSGFNMFAMSVLSFPAQLYCIPDNFLEEVRCACLQFMLGPYQWLHGSGGHSYFRAAVDMGMKAVPRCPIASSMSILYGSMIKFVPDFATKLQQLRQALAEGDNCLQAGHVIISSPYFHCRQLYDKLSSDGALIRINRLDSNTKLSKGVYDTIFNVVHPVGSVHARLEQSYKLRWCKPHLVNCPKPARLAEAAIARLEWLSSKVPPRVHSACIRLQFNA